jgi:hypothetical protein
LKTRIPPQIENVCVWIRRYIENRDYRFSKHALARKIERSVSYRDVVHALLHGACNLKKTSFDDKRQLWKYAIEGQTFDGTWVRVIVAFDKGMVIITIIRLVKKL